MSWLPFAIPLFLLLCVPALFRANELFALSVRDGRTLLLRGRIPATLHEQFQDVVARGRVRCATLRVVRSAGVPQLLADGVDASVAQRLRNVLGTYPDHRLRAAPKPRRRNWGQRLGVAWLAWRLSDRA